MDDLGRNLADETGEMVPETVVSASAELRKRRSTRIVQAVPLQVTGVDALGRPFVEKTSSLILNCHGCRYQSKHYVLKNMWVKLEIPHPETDQPPRAVRGRVAWIQRPRTVRQLFQVALELEVPGNTWGIAFPPEDWFPFAEPEKAQAAAAGATLGTVQANPPAQHFAPSLTQPPASETEFHVSLSEPDASATAAEDGDKVRMFPSPSSTTDASLQLARQVTRLLADARQQIQAAARDAAAQAVSAEWRVSAEQWGQRLVESREALAKELSSAIERIQEETSRRSRAAHDAAADALQKDLPRWLVPQLEELAQKLTGQLSQEGAAQRAEHAQQLAGATETLRGLCLQAEETTALLRESAEKSAREIAARAEAAQQAFDETARQQEESLDSLRGSLSASAGEIQHQVAAALASAQSNWQNELNGEVEAARTRWQIAVDNSFSATQERAAGALSEHANLLLAHLQQEVTVHSAGLREAAGNTARDAERQLESLRQLVQAEAQHLDATLARATEASGQLEAFSARVETAQQQALGRFQSQVDDVLSLHRNELHRRSESIFEEIAVRIRGSFDEAGTQAVARFGQQMDSLVQPHLQQADETLHRLTGSRSLLDGALTLQQQRIRESTEETFAQALAQFRANLGGVEQLLRESAETIVTQNLADLEAKTQNLKNQTVEDLAKSSEWYEKRAQTQIQAVAEKISEQTSAQLREKAGAISSEFSSEADQSSRDFVSYAQTQMADVVSEAFDRARALFAEAAETTSAAFIDEIQRHARQDLEGFETEVRKTATDTRAELQAAHEELTERVTAEQGDFLQRFRGSMSGAIETGVTEANQRVQAGFEPLLKSWKSMTDAHQAEMRNIYGRIGEQAADHYRGRLDNVSNQWMLATVTSLDHQSREAVSKIAISAEEKLRDTCAKVFNDIGEALRERLQQIASNLNSPPTSSATP